MAAPATLIVHGHPPRIRSSYGHPSSYQACRPGPARVELKVEGQKKPAATAKLDIGKGRYTIIAVPEGKKVGLRVYKDGEATPGKARLRTINAASELGGAEMRVDGQPMAELRPGRATSYASVPPGRHDLSVTRQDGTGGAIVTRRNAPLVAGTASTAILVGSGGEPTDIVLVSDQTAGPSVAPATGFVGDPGGGAPWLLAALAALAAGWVGGTAYLLAARRDPRLPVPSLPPVVLRRDPPPPPTMPPLPEKRTHALYQPPPPSGRWAVVAAAATLVAGAAGRLARKRRRG
jgi:hypothetical protein